jgi:hypothetical protein
VVQQQDGVDEVNQLHRATDMDITYVKSKGESQSPINGSRHI